MEKVAIDDLPSYMGPADEKRPVADAVGAEHLALNYYELAPGDSFAFGYHAHSDQEEVFYVQSGTVTFETDEGPVEVGPREVVRFPPGEYQRGVNRSGQAGPGGETGDGEATDDDGEATDGDGERVVALALGAPPDSEETDVRRDCVDCGERTAQSIEMTDDGDALVTVCEGCGAETGRFT